MTNRIPAVSVINAEARAPLYSHIPESLSAEQFAKFLRCACVIPTDAMFLANWNTWIIGIQVIRGGDGIRLQNMISAPVEAVEEFTSAVGKYIKQIRVEPGTVAMLSLHAELESILPGACFEIFRVAEISTTGYKFWRPDEAPPEVLEFFATKEIEPPAPDTGA